MNKEYTFEQIVRENDGFLRGPFGGDLKKDLFVQKSIETYKVYEQGVVLEQNKDLGRYYISNEYFTKKMYKFEVKTGDFLVSCSGVNYGAIFQLKGLIEKGVINQALLRIRLDSKIIDDDFFLYYFNHYIVKAITQGTGDSTIPNFPAMSVVRKIPIKLPSLKYQKIIGKTLSSIDKKIQNNNTIIKELESMAKTLYDYWFVQFDFPNENGKPYKSTGGAMVYNEELKREIPDGWEVVTVGDLVNIFDSQRVPLSQNERNLRQGNIPYYGATGIMDYIDTFIFDGKYVLLAEDGSVMDSNGFPIVQLIWGKTWVNNHAHVLNTKGAYYNEILYLILQKIPVVSIMTGSIQKKINQDNLVNYKVLDIPSILLDNSKQLFVPIFDKIQKLTIENNELTSLRDWILPMLMNGQATVE